ncbi:MAG: leucine-rich repeat protein [Treponema sp.]|nr:leucine-rich repeat protein [Treponema sp.]
MRKYSRLAIVFSHDSPDEVESGTTIQLTNGTNMVEVSDFETALGLLPPGSEVQVIARGTVGNKTVHRISRIIRESGVLVSLDLSEVTECSRVFDSPFEGNEKLTGISFPNNLVAINSRAFAGCTSLFSVHIPATCVKIGQSAFLGCGKLHRMIFADSANWFAGETAADDLHNEFENPAKFSADDAPYAKIELNKRSV